jgi:hypothetical protein
MIIFVNKDAKLEILVIFPEKCTNNAIKPTEIPANRRKSMEYLTEAKKGFSSSILAGLSYNEDVKTSNANNIIIPKKMTTNPKYLLAK